MNGQQIALAYIVSALATALFQWPAGILILFMIAHVNGDLNSNKEA